MGNEDGNGRSRRRTILIALIAALLLGGAVFAFGVLSQSAEYPITQGIHYDASDGPEVEVNQTINTTAQQPFPDSNTVDLQPHGEFRSDGPTSVQVTDIDSSWTNLSELGVSDYSLVADLSNKQTIEVGGDTDWIEYREMTVDDDAVDFRYAGPDNGTTTLLIHDLPAGETIVAWDADTGERLGYGEASSGGVASFSLPQSQHDVELETASSAEFNDSSASPTGPQSEIPSELSVDVSHAGFPDTTVDVEFFVNGQSVGIDTLSSNGTASITSELAAEAGSNEWYAVATDGYGQEVQSSTYSFSVPDTLQIYNESSPTQLVNETEVRLDFYFDSGETATRTTETGEIDMSGLPAGEPFVVVASADDYHPRRIYLSGLAEEGEMYLLPTSEEYVDLTFDLEDFTGDYPQEDTVLKIQRSINNEWKTVEGDYFGATGQFTAQLEYNQRHRLILRNTETGQERNVGTITPTSSGIQTVQVTGSDTILLEDVGPTVTIEPSVRALAATSGASVNAEVTSSNGIEEWSMTATLHSGGQETVLYDETFDGTRESASPTFNLTGEEGGMLSVEIEVVTSDGTTMIRTARYSIREHYDHDYSLFGSLARGVGLLPGDGEGGTTFLSVVITALVSVSVASVMRVGTEGVAATALVGLSAFAVIGWVPMGLVFAGGVTGVALFAIRRGM